MKKCRLLLAAAGCLFVLLTSCENWVISENKRVTFALVINTKIYTAKTIRAEVRVGSTSGELLETVEAEFSDYPNTDKEIDWAQMTTLEEIPTNQRYRLDFYIDMDGLGTKNAGDLQGYQEFEVTPNAVWSETKYFYEDLEVVP